MHRGTAFALFVIVVALPLAFFGGCAMFGGSGIEMKKSGDYSTNPPASWKKTSSGEGDEAFQLPSGAIATLNSSCGRNASAPLEVLTKHLMIGSRNVEIEKRETMTVAGVDGLLSKARATFEGRMFHMWLFVLPLKGCVYDFSLIDPKELSDSDVQSFLSFVKSFKYGRD